VRLFVALDLPPHARAALERIPLDEAVWRRVGTPHVTLAFLGEREDPTPYVDVVSREAGAPAPALTFQRLVVLRTALAVELGHEQLAALQQRIAQGVDAVEARAFRAHVTIARLKPRARRPRRVLAPLEPLAFHGTAVTLYASRLHPSGARYEALASASLTAP
jgi:RNA 2',3'-cyclic 3'-phosphodiesterase